MAILLAVPATLVGCDVAYNELSGNGRRTRAMVTALDSARPTAPYLSSFVRKYPDAEVTYRFYSADHKLGYIASVNLYGRYELELRLQPEFNWNHKKVVAYGEPSFSLVEIEKQEGSGRSYVGKTSERVFGATEWQTILEHGGDFGAIGFFMVTNSPAPGYMKWPKSAKFGTSMD
ncbi:MAG: hypothetical protein ABIQ35_10285 [Verrucomicrobiota bacterium]